MLIIQQLSYSVVDLLSVAAAWWVDYWNVMDVQFKFCEL